MSIFLFVKLGSSGIAGENITRRLTDRLAEQLHKLCFFRKSRQSLLVFPMNPYANKDPAAFKESFPSLCSEDVVGHLQKQCVLLGQNPKPHRLGYHSTIPRRQRIPVVKEVEACFF